MPYQGNTKSPRVPTEKRTDPFTSQKNPPPPGRMGNLCEMNQIKSFQDSKASSILTVDHQMASYSLNTDNRWLEDLTKRHQFRTVSDRVLVPRDKFPEGPRIDGIGPPMVLNSEGKDLGDHDSGEEKWHLEREQKGSVAGQRGTRMTGRGDSPQ
jgi:hypothetical protein